MNSYLGRALAAKEKMREVGDRWLETKSGIQNDPSLSDVGKQEYLAEHRAAYARDYRKWKSQYHEALVKGEIELERRLFRTSFFETDVLAQHDARDRVRNIDNAELIQVFEESLLYGDRSLSGACFRAALERRIGLESSASDDLKHDINHVQEEIIQKYLEDHPDRRGAFNDYLELKAEKDPPSDTKGRFAFALEQSMHQNAELESHVDPPYESGQINFTRG